MKYLIEKIEEAAEKAGGKAELAKNLEISRTVISDVLGSRRGLPLDACYKLADMTGANLARIVAENEAITAKKEKAEFWKKKLMEFEKLAACILVGVILNMSPTPSQAAQSLQAIDLTLYIMSNCWIKIMRLKQLILQDLKMRIPEPLLCFLVPRIRHVTA